MKTSYILLLLLGFGVYAASVSAGREPLVVTVNGNGQVTSQPAGITCPDDCFENFREGLTITLTASAGPGSSFTGWSGACAHKDPTCVVKMRKSRAVTASFSQK